MTLGIVGTVVEDTIDTADGRRTRDMGGLYYGVLTLATLAPEGTRVLPVCAVGSDVVDRVRRDWSRREGVAPDGIVEVPQVNNKVHLEYRDAGERDETLTGGVPPLAWSDLEGPLKAAEAWSWNFVSGVEAERDVFERVKSSLAVPLHLDLHSICLGFDADGLRRPRRPPDWEGWVEGATWLQVNALEAGLLWTGEAEPLPARREHELARRVHELGIEGVIVTRGAEGAAWHPSRGTACRATGDAPGPVVDPTGCGDVFGAAWLALREGHGLDPAEALAGAVRAAGVAATLRGTSGLDDALRADGPLSVRTRPLDPETR